MAMNITRDLVLTVHTIIPIAVPFWVALRKTEDGTITADMNTFGATKAETELKILVENEQLPDWCADYPVAMIAKFRLADGYIDEGGE